MYMSSDSLLASVRQYYDEKIQTHGPTAQGVDWKSPESQQLRFAELLKLVDTSDYFTIIDYGCGYGALADYLKKLDYKFGYVGFDISSHMISKAKCLHSNTDITFVDDERALVTADYTVASGIFNVKLDTPYNEWSEYVLATLEKMNRLSKRGFAFNVLTKYSDPEFKRADLYYADPLFYFDHCKINYSRFVSLIHDYPLYEFTISVRKEV